MRASARGRGEAEGSEVPSRRHMEFGEAEDKARGQITQRRGRDAGLQRQCDGPHVSRSGN